MTDHQTPPLLHALKRAEAVLDKANTHSKIETATHIATEFSGRQMSAREREIALGILDILARGVEVEVRAAVAAHIKDSPDLPREMALAMARDVEQVALPIIRFSTVLVEADLIEIVASGDLVKQIAVSERERLGEPVSRALIETGREPVVVSLLKNKSAAIGEPSYGRIMDQFAGSASVQHALIDRSALPLSAVERLISCVAVELQDKIIQRFKISPQQAAVLTGRAREDVLVRSTEKRNREEVSGLTKRMLSKDEITPTLILGALAQGELVMFETAMSTLAGMELEHTKTFLYSRGAGGLRMVFRNTAMPPDLFRLIRIAVEAVNELTAGASGADAKTISSTIIGRWTSAFEGIDGGTDPETVVNQLVRRFLGAGNGERDSAA